MEDFQLLFHTYEKDKADQVIALLESNNISFKISSTANNIEPILGAASSNQFEVLVPQTLHGNASELIAGIQENIETEVDLSAYSDEEIKDILLNPTEWHGTFVLSAKDIALERNLDFDFSQPILVNDKESEVVESIEEQSQKANKEARATLFIIAAINVIIPVILIGRGDGIKIFNLLFYMTGAITYACLGLMAKRLPLFSSFFGLALLLTVYLLTYLGDPSMITRYVWLKISLVVGLGYAIVKGIQLRMSQ